MASAAAGVRATLVPAPRSRTNPAIGIDRGSLFMRRSPSLRTAPRLGRARGEPLRYRRRSSGPPTGTDGQRWPLLLLVLARAGRTVRQRDHVADFEPRHGEIAD